MIRVYLPTIARQGNDIWKIYEFINTQGRQFEELGHRAKYCSKTGRLFVEFVDETQAALFKLTHL